MLEIRELKKEEHILFQEKTTKAYKSKMLTKDGNTVAVGCWLNKIPVGLALFEMPNHGESNETEAFLFSIFVTSLYRRMGIAKQLLEKSEVILFERGINRIEGEYAKEHPRSGIIEKLLNSMQWEYEPYRMLISTQHGVGLLDDPLLRRISKSLSEDYEYFFWKDLSASDMETLKAKIGNLSAGLQPFSDYYIDYLHYNSLGLRYKGDVVGWMLTLKYMSPNTTDYANMYVFPEHAKLGYGMGLFYNSFELERTYLGNKYAQHSIVAHVYHINNKMTKLTERRLLKYTSKSIRYQSFSKSLSNSKL